MCWLGRSSERFGEERGENEWAHYNFVDAMRAYCLSSCSVVGDGLHILIESPPIEGL